MWCGKKIGLLKLFAAVFRTVTSSIRQYIRQRRLHHLAAVELRTTERPILISRWTRFMCRSKLIPACIPPRVRRTQRLQMPPVGDAARVSSEGAGVCYTNPGR